MFIRNRFRDESTSHRCCRRSHRDPSLRTRSARSRKKQRLRILSSSMRPPALGPLCCVPTQTTASFLYYSHYIPKFKSVSVEVSLTHCYLEGKSGAKVSDAPGVPSGFRDVSDVGVLGHHRRPRWHSTCVSRVPAWVRRVHQREQVPVRWLLCAPVAPLKMLSR